MQIVVCDNCKTRNRVNEAKLATSEAKCGRCGKKLRASSTHAQIRPVVVTDQNFHTEVVLASTTVPVILDCWAPWCGPCRAIAPVMDQLAAESDGRYRVAKLNVDDNPRTASEFQIASIPTMLIFKDGKLIDRLIGAQPKQAILDRLQLAARFGASAR